MNAEMKKPGLSFKEVLIVVSIVLSIIVFLLAIPLIPALIRARESSNRARCMSHLRQIGLALKQYALDNNEVLPWNTADSTQYCRSMGMTYPAYISDLSIFRCPSSGDNLIKSENNLKAQPFSEAMVYNLSYAYSHNQGKPWTEEATSSTRIAADKYATHDYDQEPYPSGKPINHLDSHDLWPRRNPLGRNVVMFDGSAGWNNRITPLEVDYEWCVIKGLTDQDENSNPENDQTGPDWWSDPPDKK